MITRDEKLLHIEQWLEEDYEARDLLIKEFDLEPGTIMEVAKQIIELFSKKD